MRTGTLLLSHITPLSHSFVPYYSLPFPITVFKVSFTYFSGSFTLIPPFTCLLLSLSLNPIWFFFIGFPVLPPPPPIFCLQVNHNNIRWFRNLFKKQNVHLSEKRIDRSIDVDLKIYEKSRESNYTSMRAAFQVLASNQK